MRRKVVLQGGTALTVALPIKWAKRNNIKKGDEIHLIENPDKLELYSEEKKDISLAKNSTTLLYDPERCWRQLASLYSNGYHEIKLKLTKPRDLEDLEQMVSNLMGWAIVEQKRDQCLIKSISEPDDKEFKNILRRSFLVLLNISELILEFSQTYNSELQTQIISLGKINRKLHLFCKRQILKRKNYSYSIQIHSLIKDLSRLTHEYLFISDLITQNKKIQNEQTRLILNKINKFLAKGYENFYSSKNNTLDQRKEEFNLSESNLNLISTLSNLSLTIIIHDAQNKLSEKKLSSIVFLQPL